MDPCPTYLISHAGAIPFQSPWTDGHPLLESEEPSGAVLFVPIPVGLGYRLHNAEHLGNPTMAV